MLLDKNGLNWNSVKGTTPVRQSDKWHGTAGLIDVLGGFCTVEVA